MSDIYYDNLFECTVQETILDKFYTEFYVKCLGKNVEKISKIQFYEYVRKM